jgi:hypothetical protein
MLPECVFKNVTYNKGSLKLPHLYNDMSNTRVAEIVQSKVNWSRSQKYKLHSLRVAGALTVDSNHVSDRQLQ